MTAAKQAEPKYDYRNPRPLPDEYPVFDLSDPEIVFSTLRGPPYYLSYHEGQCDLVDRKWQKVAGSLFFSGGTVESHGLKLKDGLDRDAVYRCLKALLSSWGPKHEEKEATVGFAISKWFEPNEAEK